MSTLTFIVAETPDPKLAKVGTRFTLEEAAQLLELNAQEMFTQAYLAERVTHCGFTLRVLLEPRGAQRRKRQRRSAWAVA